MKPEKQRIIVAVEEVAAALEELVEEVVFVGGAVVGLYADDPLAGDVRPTKDVDLVFKIVSYNALENLEKILSGKGFRRKADEKVVCRFAYKNILVDIMSTKEVGWAPANYWFAEGFKKPITFDLNIGSVKILPFPYFLATKFTAFSDRGGDPRISHDFEDIVYLLDNRLNSVEDILNADDEVKKFLVNEFKKIIERSDLQEAVIAHLDPGTQAERNKILQDKLKEIIE